MAYSVVSEPGALETYGASVRGAKSGCGKNQGSGGDLDECNTSEDAAIIRYAIFQKMSWSEVAIKLGRKATADSVRMEFQRFMEEK